MSTLDSERVIQSRTAHKRKLFDELVKAAGMKDRGIEIPVEQDNDSYEAIILIRDVDIEDMELSRGQRCIQRRWHTSLERRTEYIRASVLRVCLRWKERQRDR